MLLLDTFSAERESENSLMNENVPVNGWRGDEIFKLGAEGNVRLYTQKKRAFENNTRFFFLFFPLIVIIYTSACASSSIQMMIGPRVLLWRRTNELSALLFTGTKKRGKRGQRRITRNKCTSHVYLHTHFN